MSDRIAASLRAAFIAGAVLAMAAPACSAPNPSAVAAAAARQRLAIFDYVWTEIRDKYYDPSLNGADWAAVRARYRPMVDGARDDAAFHYLLRAAVSQLRDAHTKVLNARQARDREAEQSTSTGAILFEAEGQPVVFIVRPGSPAAEAGLQPGMRVLSVNGVPISQALASARAEVGPSSSDRGALVLSYLRLVAGAPGDLLHLGLARADGSAMTVDLPRRAHDSTPRFESRRLASGAGYVKFDRFAEPVAVRFRAALEGFRDAPGLIIDLRSNTGGDGKEGMRTIAPLLAEPLLVGRLATRTGKPPSALFGLVTLPLALSAGEAGGQLYAGPVVILTNEGTASTSEVIAASLQERGRAKIVGTRSCGCALGVLKYRKLKNGGALAISEIGLVSGLGRRIEGEGVVPDVPVALKLADLQSGADPAIEEAERLLAAMRGRP